MDTIQKKPKLNTVIWYCFKSVSCHPPVTPLYLLQELIFQHATDQRSITSIRRSSGSCGFFSKRIINYQKTTPSCSRLILQISEVPINLNVKQAPQHRVKHVISHNKQVRDADLSQEEGYGNAGDFAALRGIETGRGEERGMRRGNQEDFRCRY